MRVDAHAHLLNLGFSLANVNLADTRSYDEVIRRVVERVPSVAPGRWILGRGWDQNKWGDTRFPTHEALSRATPNNPVVLTRISTPVAPRASNESGAEVDGMVPRCFPDASGC